MRTLRGACAAAVVGAVLAGLVVRAGGPPARAASATVVVSQVYGGGGNQGARYTHDFVELFNRGTTAADLAGWSVQYAATTGSSWGKTLLSGTVQPGRHFLIQEAQGAGGTTPLPTPDLVAVPVASGGPGIFNLSAIAGKVALVGHGTTLSGSCPLGAGVVDLVGYRAGTDCAEGGAPAPTLSNTTAARRRAAGCVDTDRNGADFFRWTPLPRNSSAPAVSCSAAA